MKKLLLIFLIPFVIKAQGLTGVLGLLNDNTDSLVADFTFTDVTLAYSYTEYISDSIIVSKINVPTSISVSNCFYRKGLSGSFTSSSSTVSLGDTVWLMDTTGATGSTYGGTLTIGSVSDAWTVNCPLQSIAIGLDNYITMTSAITLDADENWKIEFSMKDTSNIPSANNGTYCHLFSKGNQYRGNFATDHNGYNYFSYRDNDDGSYSYVYTPDTYKNNWVDVKLECESDSLIHVYIDNVDQNEDMAFEDAWAWSQISTAIASQRWGGELGTITVTHNGSVVAIWDWSGADTNARLEDKSGNVNHLTWN